MASLIARMADLASGTDYAAIELVADSERSELTSAMAGLQGVVLLKSKLTEEDITLDVSYWLCFMAADIIGPFELNLWRIAFTSVVAAASTTVEV